MMRNPLNLLKLVRVLIFLLQLPNDGLGYNSGLSTQVLNQSNVGAYKLTFIYMQKWQEINSKVQALPQALPLEMAHNFATKLNSKSGSGNDGLILT